MIDKNCRIYSKIYIVSVETYAGFKLLPIGSGTLSYTVFANDKKQRFLQATGVNSF